MKKKNLVKNLYLDNSIMEKKDKDLKNLSLLVKLVLWMSLSVSLVVAIFIILLLFIGTKV